MDRDMYHMTGGCTSSQKGKAAEFRGEDLTRSDRRTANQIVHSADPVHKNSGNKTNPYYDTSNSYDAKAQKALDNMEKKYGKRRE